MYNKINKKKLKSNQRSKKINNKILIMIKKKLKKKKFKEFWDKDNKMTLIINDVNKSIFVFL